MADGHGAPFPGLIDLQVNGTHGIDFSAEGLTVDDCLQAFDLIRAAGVAAFLPTVITSPVDRCKANLATIVAAATRYRHPDLIAGVHLEGPFLDPTPGAIGAHNPDWVHSPDPSLFDALQDAAGGMLRMLTVSADIIGIEPLIAHAAAKGVTVSLGHQMAGYTAMRQAADAGATLLTHLGNGLPHEVNRHENPLLAGLAERRLGAMIIADGHHLPDELALLILRVKGLEHTIAVSDAAPVVGLPPGRYTTLGNSVEVTAEGLVVNPGTRYLAGSGRTLLDCVNRLAGTGLFSCDELVTMAMRNPARIVGIDPDTLSGPGLRYDPRAGRFVAA